MPTDHERRYVRVPSPEQKPRMVISRFFAYDTDGNFKGEVRLTNERKRWYEARGYTFKRRHS